MSDAVGNAVSAAAESGETRLAFATPQWLFFESEQPTGRFYAAVFMPEELRRQGLDVTSEPPAALRPVYNRLADKVRRARRSLKGDPAFSKIRLSNSPKTGQVWLADVAPVRRFSQGFPATESLPIFAKALAVACHRLHQLGALHLDLHPDVIGIDAEQEIVLLGAGVDIRAEVAAIATDNSSLARPGFAAPELWDGSGLSPLGPWTDVYGLSATFYACATRAPPPDFRQRAADPTAAETMLATLDEALAPAGEEGRALARAIVAGLSPKAKDRPRDILAWAALLVAAPPPPEPGSPPSIDVGTPQPLRDGSEEAERDAPARTLDETSTLAFTPSVRSPRRDIRPLLAVGVALATLAAAGVGVWSLRDEIDGLFSPPAPPPPAASPAPKAAEVAAVETPPQPVWPAGRLAGLEYIDDPAALAGTLRTARTVDGGAAPSDADLGAVAERLFRRYRADDDPACATPLRVHRRADGEGLLIQRPGGDLVWRTRWSFDSAQPVNELGVSVESVFADGAELDVLGLVGSQRRLVVGADELAIVYASGDTSERETYTACDTGA